LTILSAPEVEFELNGILTEIDDVVNHLCEGDEVVLTASVHPSLSWNYGITNGIPFVPSIGLKKYVASVNDALGCTVETDITTEVHELPEPEIEQEGNELVTGIFAEYQWYRDNIVIADGNSQRISPVFEGNYHVEVKSDVGCSNSSQPYPFAFTGLNEMDQSQSWTLYPNPGHDLIQILLPGNSGEEAVVTITDLTGREISNRLYAIPGKEAFSIDASSFERGLYLVKITIGNRAEVFKWQKN
jgi:hypothetical protein